MFSGGEGVGLRDETCVMVGETAGGSIVSDVSVLGALNRRLERRVASSAEQTTTYEERRGLARVGRGISAFVS